MIRACILSAIVLVPISVSAQSRYNQTPSTPTTQVIRNYTTGGVTATVAPNSQGTPVIRDYRTNGVVATVERNSQGETIIRDYRTGRVLSTVGK